MSFKNIAWEVAHAILGFFAPILLFTVGGEFTYRVSNIFNVKDFSSSSVSFLVGHIVVGIIAGIILFLVQYRVDKRERMIRAILFVIFYIIMAIIINNFLSHLDFSWAT
jgi:Na+/melibiose symporter-like transporter